jgi:hypothetical protein
MTFIFLTYSGMLFAQDGAGLMKKLKKMEKCMQGLDRTELKRMEHESVQVQSKMTALCDSGKQAEARVIAIDFSEQVTKSLTIKQFKKCAKTMEGIMPAMPLLDMPVDFGEINVCN